MMLFHLLKKDVLIVKKYVLIVLVIAVLIPPFMFWRAPEFSGILGFMLAAVYCILLLLQYVSLKEYQFPKASTLLCATPFSREMMVLSKYIFCIAVYVACCVIYALETLLIPTFEIADATIFFLMFLAVSALIGVYLPVQYKIGFEKGRFVFVVVIMASPIILPWFMKMGMLNLNFLSAWSPLLVCGGAFVLSCMILLVSVVLSMKFYNEKDLA